MTSRLMDICPEVTTGGRESHPRIEISIYFLMLMHKKVGFSGFLCFCGIDAGAKVVYTEYRQTGGSPEVVAGGRKPERGLKLRFVFLWKSLSKKDRNFRSFLFYANQSRGLKRLTSWISRKIKKIPAFPSLPTRRSARAPCRTRIRLWLSRPRAGCAARGR